MCSNSSFRTMQCMIDICMYEHIWYSKATNNNKNNCHRQRWYASEKNKSWNETKQNKHGKKRNEYACLKLCRITFGWTYFFLFFSLLQRIFYLYFLWTADFSIWSIFISQFNVTLNFYTRFSLSLNLSICYFIHTDIL